MDKGLDDVWAEIAVLKRELKHLEVKRESLTAHLARLQETAAQAKAQAQRLDEMAEEVQQILEGEE